MEAARNATATTATDESLRNTEQQNDGEEGRLGQPEDPMQNTNRHIPWQMEWKHPQWITSQAPPASEADDNDNAEVVGVTSSRLSQPEISQLLSDGMGEDRHYLLTVTLLGQRSLEETGQATIGETGHPAAASLASEVLLEVLDVPSATLSNDATKVVRKKRLRWPESIFDGTSGARDSRPESAARNHTRKRKAAKRKNLLASVFLPLMGIDEEDEYVQRDERPPRAGPNRQSTIGIVSATLCRRPRKDLRARSKASAERDILELMSFGPGSHEGGTGDVSVSNSGDSNSVKAREEDPQNGEYSSTNYTQSIIEGSLKESQQEHQQGYRVEDCGELAFVCVSQAGEVFVYDPIKLLLGVEDVSDLNEGERNAKKGLEDVSTFFFGQELFQNLQETWKPLAEPSARIHLSLFEHENQKHRSNAHPGIPAKNLTHSNQELSDLTKSILSKESGSKGSSTSRRKDDTIGKNRLRRRGQGGDSRITSGDSVSTFQSGDDGDSSTIATSATDALTVVQTMALELQTGADEALSMLPYLLNPLLEPSTLKDRTIQNRPLNISAAGNAYIVVTGSGMKMKNQRNLNRIDTSSSLGSLQRPSGEESISTDEVATALPHEKSETIDSREEKIIENPSSSLIERKDDSEKVNDLANTDELYTGEEQNCTSKNNKTDPDQETSVHDDRGSFGVGITDNDVGTSSLEGGDKNEAEDVTQRDEGWENESAADQEDSSSGKTPLRTQMDGSLKSNSDNSQLHYFDGYEDSYVGSDIPDRGGFVTFLSSEQWSETRTLFLPFVPVRTSHVSQWNGMELLWVIGEFETLLIRMDSTGPVPVTIGNVVFGGETLRDETNLFQAASSSNRTGFSDGIESRNELLPLSVKKFQILPIDLGAKGFSSPRLLCASSTGINPPSVLELHVSRDANLHFRRAFGDEIVTNHQPRQYPQHQYGLVLLKTLDYCTPQGTVVLRHAPSHVAKILIDQEKTVAAPEIPNKEEPFFDDIWAQHGQGWSLVGSNMHMHFICWEGSTLLQGAYVQELGNFDHCAPYKPLHATYILPLSNNNDAMPQPKPFHLHSDIESGQDFSPTGRFIQRDRLLDNPQRFSSAIVNLPDIDEFHPARSPSDEINKQLDGEKFYPKGSSNVISDISKSTSSSRRENSEHLLQQCSSWTQLEDTLKDRIVLDRQEPILFVRSGKAGSRHTMLSLRQLVVDNGISSPFQQVLAWLAKKRNFFVAAGIALDLLQDADSLYHLWKHAEMIDEEDEETKLIGLLDGISPVRLLDNHDRTNEFKHSVTATHLSEMTIGCFIKGGATMSKTLVRFLENNKSYDPTRASLMLSLTTIDLFSDNMLRIQNSKTSNSVVVNQEDIFDECLWPVECLLTIGSEREYLNEVLELLNNTIPDELRHRHSEDEKDGEEIPADMLMLTKKLVKLILESDPIALDILMGFVDDRSGVNFWQSLDQNTRLALFLMDIDSSYPFLRHPDSRMWARGELDLCFQGQSNLPTTWLQGLSLACLRNAKCDQNDLRIDKDDNKSLSETPKIEANLTMSVATSEVSDLATQEPEESNSGFKDSHIWEMKHEWNTTRNALLASPDEDFGVDHDLLIPTLLLLESRDSHWLPSSQFELSSTGSSPHEKSFVPTQSLLNAACHLAGRTPIPDRVRQSDDFSASPPNRFDDETFVEFDSTSAMKQCYQAKNVVAGAYLIGGTNGFILHVCDVLNRGIGISVSDAESFLLSDRLDLEAIKATKNESKKFELTDWHKILLLLLEEHVLEIKTFGDFDFANNRGQVDPVFAARSILRAWLSLSLGDKSTASSWLGEWLGVRLQLRSKASSKTFAKNDLTPRTKTTAIPSFDQSDHRADPKADSGQHQAPHSHRLACASLVRSLLWPNNKATPKTSVDKFDGAASHIIDHDSLPLAATMEFEKKLIIQLCQSCLGLVESVPSAVVHEIQI